MVCATLPRSAMLGAIGAAGLWRNCSCLVRARLDRGISRQATRLKLRSSVLLPNWRAVDITPCQRYGDRPVRRTFCRRTFMDPTRLISSFSLMRACTKVSHSHWRLRLWSQAAAKASKQAGAAAAGGYRRQAGQAHRISTTTNMSAASSRSIRSRCARASRAISTGVHFKDGQMVKQGDLLFTIDKRPFQNALDQARANLAQAKPIWLSPNPTLARGQQLVRDKTITEQTFEQRAQAYRNAKASVAAQRGGRAPGRARSGIHRIARAGHRPHRRPARLARQSRHRRHRRQHDAARHHRVDRSDPFRVHLR